jgi:hypothetical protein
MPILKVRVLIRRLISALLLASTSAVLAQAPSPKENYSKQVELFDMTCGKTSVLRMTPRTLAVMFDLAGARGYMLELINRDRASVGLPAVVLDAIASKAAQEHSDEMAAKGYLGHWGLDGRKPDQRYTEVGGRDAAFENAMAWHHLSICRTSPQAFAKLKLDSCQSGFFKEKPPNDGHRRQIIDPVHTGVGIGLSLMAEGEIACVQEFINHYGDYSGMPCKVKRGEDFSLVGRLNKGAHLDHIELRREEFPQPMSQPKSIKLAHTASLML